MQQNTAELLSKLNGYLLQYGMNLIAAILIFFIGRWVARLLSRITEKAMQRAKVNESLASFTKNIIY
ncbi:MAG: hypothetical protein NT033_07745 [Candidatus Omnitrophica bacterium]|nr:hypothetical protein [Candidatus Omnitrophota bacterium]